MHGMGQVVYGAFNASAALLDDVYVAVQQPQPVIGGGQSTFVGGAVGGACWGPTNVPQNGGSAAQLMGLWGPPIGSGFDLVQEGALFLKQLPLGGFTGVRVTDGTDVKSTGSFQSLAVSGRWTGAFGNSISILLIAGSLSTTATPTWRIIVQAGLAQPEVFDNIAQSSTPATTWANIIAAINAGQSTTRGPSNFITMALSGSGSSQPTALSNVVTLAGGTNGTSNITTSIQLGADGGAGSRTGLYALRNQGLDQVWLCGAGGRDYSNAGSALIAFARSELCMAHIGQPTGQSPTLSVTNKANAGLYDPYLIFNHDDVVFLDSYLQNYYAVPMACVVAGRCCSLSAQLSPGNQPVNGIIATWWDYNNNQSYSNSDLGSMESAGIMVINNPINAGQVYGLRHGKNSIGLTNFAVSEIPYARMTNMLVTAFQGSVMGQFVNKNQTTKANDPLREGVETAFNAFLGPMVDNNIIDAYSATCDLTNNPPAQIVQGILQADVAVQYLSVVDKFVINLTAGQTVSVNSSGPNVLPTGNG
jgi:hypothetical protein